LWFNKKRLEKYKKNRLFLFLKKIIDSRRLGMSEYLSKEEIRQWRSSLEKITLEEYALRLGKTINTQKETNDLADIVLNANVAHETMTANMSIKTSLPINDVKITEISSKVASVIAKAEEKKEEILAPINYEFRKALTDREKMVFDYFVKNRGTTVFAKDLAGLLSLPRDYVYKYIKNLRAKLSDDLLVNSDDGGYFLKA
jgi:hypothetical protein